MPTVQVNGLTIAYELHGDSGDPVVITPGGRFSMDAPGVRELARALAAGGKRALIWDRPNTGASDVCFESRFESRMHADTLAGLLERLELPRATVVGGSAGARVSLLAAAHHPEVTDAIAIWWISGGFFGLLVLAAHYCAENWTAAIRGGMEEVCSLAAWQETFQKNPANRERMLAMDPDVFAARMVEWGPGFLQTPASPVPGMRPEDFAAITVPAMVFRSGPRDPAHPREVSEQVHALLPRSRLVEPPWGEEEWNAQGYEFRATGRNVLFEHWPQLAPQLVEFTGLPTPPA